jgi:hypothetical protein
LRVPDPLSIPKPSKLYKGKFEVAKVWNSSDELEIKPFQPPKMQVVAAVHSIVQKRSPTLNIVNQSLGSFQESPTVLY